jgi:hypothetical protein
MKKSACSAALASILAWGMLVSISTAEAADLTAQDYVEIEQLYARYNHAIDDGDAEGWADTFTADGTFNQFTGREALVGFIHAWREKRNGANRRHWNSNLMITPSAEGASGKVMLMLVDISTTPPSIASMGRYTDVLVKTPGGWRFKNRQVRGDAAAAPQAKP